MRPLFILTLLLMSTLPFSDFKSEQMKFPRVKEAYKLKQNIIEEVLSKHGLSTKTLEIFIRVFKKEKILELWAKNKPGKFILIKNYKICSLSGKLGPKRKQGDDQTPEGFYYISSFNPVSNFYLSLGVDYPNNSDRILSKSKNLGGDIFIHGNCVTIGCIPITDDKIKELYIYAIEAKNSGQQNIPVHIFPTTLDDESMKNLQNEYKTEKDLLAFWESLKAGYDYFEKSNELPKISINKSGYYKFSKYMTKFENNL